MNIFRLAMFIAMFLGGNMALTQVDVGTTAGGAEATGIIKDAQATPRRGQLVVPMYEDSSNELQIAGESTIYPVRLPNLEFAEDATHTTADKGIMPLSVRKDTATALAGADGDYQPLITDASGRLHIAPLPANSGVDIGDVGIADGDDVALGSTTDAAATAGGTGTLSAKLRLVTTQLDNQLTATKARTRTSLTVANGTGTAYASGDTVGARMEFDNAAQAVGEGGIIESVTVIDSDGQGMPLTIFFFRVDSTTLVGTYNDNAAMLIAANDRPHLVGFVNVDAADYTTGGNSEEFAYKELDMPFITSGDDKITVVVMARGTNTFAAGSAILLNIEIKQDN